MLKYSYSVYVHVNALTAQFAHGTASIISQWGRKAQDPCLKQLRPQKHLKALSLLALIPPLLRVPIHLVLKGRLTVVRAHDKLLKALESDAASMSDDGSTPDVSDRRAAACRRHLQ